MEVNKWPDKRTAGWRC